MRSRGIACLSLWILTLHDIKNSRRLENNNPLAVVIDALVVRVSFHQQRLPTPSPNNQLLQCSVWRISLVDALVISNHLISVFPLTMLFSFDGSLRERLAARDHSKPPVLLVFVADTMDGVQRTSSAAAAAAAVVCCFCRQWCCPVWFASTRIILSRFFGGSVTTLNILQSFTVMN